MQIAMAKKDVKAGKRLEEARRAAGFGSRAAGARAVGLEYQTYVNFENGNRSYAKHLTHFASVFGVSVERLLGVRGDDTTSPVVRVIGHVNAGAVTSIRAEEAEDFGDIALPSGEHVAALLVRGDSMFPRFRDGEYVLVDLRPRLPGALIDHEALCELGDSGDHIIKIIRRGAKYGTFDLVSHNHPTLENVDIRAAYPVLGGLHNQQSVTLPQKILPPRRR